MAFGGMGVGDDPTPPGVECFGGDTELVVSFAGHTVKLKDICHTKLVVRNADGIDQYANATVYRTPILSGQIIGRQITLANGQIIQVSPGHAFYFRKKMMEEILGIDPTHNFCRNAECPGETCPKCHSGNMKIPGFRSIQAKYLIGDKRKIKACVIKDYLYHVILHDDVEAAFRLDPKGHLLSEGLRKDLPIFGNEKYDLNCVSKMNKPVGD